MVTEFKYDSYYLEKTIEALNEDTIIEKFDKIKDSKNQNIKIINEIIFVCKDNKKKKNENYLRKLTLILLFNEKSNNKMDEVFGKICEIKKCKNILFSVLLDFNEYFGQDIKFENKDIYKEFVIYSINKEKYISTLNYLSHNIIQLNLLKEHIDKICKYNIIYKKLDKDSYKDAYQLVQDLINYQKEKGRKFISFPKTFWENYFNYYKLNPGIENKIQKLDELYELLKSYSELEPDDSEYKEQLAENIHNIIEEKIKEDNTDVKEQLVLLFEKDPYYIYEDYKNKRAPEIFKEIKIYDLYKKEDVEYFKEKDLEKIYGNSYVFVEEKEEEKNEEVKQEEIEQEEEEEEKKKYFLNTIIERIETIEHFTFIINLIKINLKKDEKNRNVYAFIELFIKRYLDFEDKDLTEESLLIFLEKVIEYSPNRRVEFLRSSLPKFLQNYNIYLKLFEKYKEDDDIQKQLANSSFSNLELNNFVEVIKKLGNEEKKINYLRI